MLSSYCRILAVLGSFAPKADFRRALDEMLS